MRYNGRMYAWKAEGQNQKGMNNWKSMKERAVQQYKLQRSENISHVKNWFCMTWKLVTWSSLGKNLWQKNKAWQKTAIFGHYGSFSVTKLCNQPFFLLSNVCHHSKHKVWCVWDSLCPNASAKNASEIWHHNHWHKGCLNSRISHCAPERPKCGSSTL